MQLGRVIKTLTAKWVIVVILAVAGASIGAILANNHNDGIRPRWRAEAPVTFFQIEEEEDSSSSRSNTSGGTVDAENERARAGLLLEETLAANPRLSIQVDREDNALLFIAVGRDGEETLAEALALRDEYEALGATVLSVDQIEATMATVLVDIDRLKEEIAALSLSEPEPEDPSITAERTALETEIATLDQRQAQIAIWILNPELRPTEDDFFGVEPETSTTRAADEEEESEEEEEPPPIVSLEQLQDEQGRNNIILLRLRNALNQLPDPPTADTLSVVDELELEALQLDLDELELQYVSLLRRLDGRPPGGFVEEPVVTDETQSERSVGLFAFLGLLVGSLLAGLAIVGYDQVRQPVWAGTDLDGLISLGFVNRKRDEATDDAIWYPTALSQRRRDIQTLRAAMDGVTGERPAIVGLFGVGVAGEEVGELAADLAASYTMADREVLLIDGNSFNPNRLPEYGPGDNVLNDVLMTAVPPEEAESRLNSFLDLASPAAPGLTALSVDAERHDPIDVFASPNCRVLMDVVANRFDMVIVAGPEISDPLADAVIHRVDIVALVGYVGYTEKVRVETVADALADRNVEVAGLVLLEGRRQPVREQIADYLRGSRDEEEPEPVSADADGTETDDETPLPSPASTRKGAEMATDDAGDEETAEDDDEEPVASSGDRDRGGDAVADPAKTVLDTAETERDKSDAARS
ncbi:MAG: hypothetical protein QNJ81_06580 [Acidimicrobiia bacterium]|nr:hypothetical protein [Acidimicrobiia bacterium]